jgi:hypothetical protein
MAEVTLRIAEIEGTDYSLYYVDEDHYEVASDAYGGFIKVTPESVDDLIDVLTTFKKEAQK